MKTYVKKSSGILAALAVAGMCLTAKADLVGGSYTTGTTQPSAWDQIGGQNPFWSSVTNANPSSAWGASQAANINNSDKIVPGAAYYVLGETMFLPSQRYTLTGISVLWGGVAPASINQIHLFDVTASMKSGDGTSITNGGGAMYDITGDLLGNGNGITFTNNGQPTATNQLIFTLANGPIGNDASIVVGDGHVYALEFWTPSAAPLGVDWGRLGANVNDAGLTGDSFMGGGEFTNRVTIAAAGNGGNPRNYILALFGTTTSNPITISSNAPPGLTNFLVDTFPSATYSGGSISTVWSNWFGTAVVNPTGVTWSSTDAYGAGNSGSMQINANFDGGTSQYAVFNGFNGNGTGTSPALNGKKLLRFEADVKFASGSATTVNGTTVNYGHLQFGTVTNGTGGDYFGSKEVAVNDNSWNHIVLPFNSTLDTNLQSIPDVIAHIDGNWYTGSPMSGSSTLNVDNVRFSGFSSVVAPPPTMLSLTPATPALRILTPSTGRENIGTLSTTMSWLAPFGGYPVSYSFFLTNFPATNALYDFRLFFVPIASLRTDYGGNWYQNTFFDNDTTNLAGLRLSATGTNYVAQFIYKINTAPGFPNNIQAEILPATMKGKWTLTFNNATTAIITPPAGTGTNFSLSFDTSAFAGDVALVFSAVANNTASEYLPVDITEAHFGAGLVDDVFANDLSIDTSGTWAIKADVPNSIWLTGLHPKYWVNWKFPDTGYALVESTNVGNPASWLVVSNLPAGNPLDVRLLGSQRWALLATNHVPTGNVQKLFFALRASQ
ncbi:MAG TPA: hypothetical protein VFD66_14030 [Verrucomicrobiae bacterium]|nr:hypothetical protein [Verrucomicrobiae bacterium]